MEYRWVHFITRWARDNMTQRSRSWIRSLLAQLFCTRNVIVVADHRVAHYTLSRRLQLLALIVFAGTIGGSSFLVGHTLAARTLLAQKEQRLHVVEKDNLWQEQRFALLRQDFLRLGLHKSDDLSDYTQFILSQYEEHAPSAINAEETATAHTDTALSEFPLHSPEVIERITFLEEKIALLEQDNQELIDGIRATTKGRVAQLENVIDTAGLRRQELLRTLRKKYAPKDGPNAKHSTSDADLGAQGGPYIPDDLGSIAAREETLFEDISDLVMLEKIIHHLPLAQPMRNARITSGFGRRVDPIRKRPAQHWGMDFVGSDGATVHATGPGTILFAGRKSGYGITVEIDHGLGITTRYAHLRETYMRPGDSVRAHTIIGVQGSTGRSTGQHLHYEVRVHGKPVNPDRFLQAAATLR